MDDRNILFKKKCKSVGLGKYKVKNNGTNNQRFFHLKVIFCEVNLSRMLPYRAQAPWDHTPTASLDRDLTHCDSPLGPYENVLPLNNWPPSQIDSALLVHVVRQDNSLRYETYFSLTEYT